MHPFGGGMTDNTNNIIDNLSDDDLDSILREVIGAERKILLDSGNSRSARNKKIKEIIERRAEGALTNDS